MSSVLQRRPGCLDLATVNAIKARVTNSWAELAVTPLTRQDSVDHRRETDEDCPDFGPNQIRPAWREVAWLHGVALAGSEPADPSKVLASLGEVT